MARADSIRGVATEYLQGIRNRASINTRYTATSLREVAARAADASSRRAARNEGSTVPPPILDQLDRQRGLGNLLDRKA